MTKALTTIFNNHHSFLKSVSWRHLARDFRFSVWISISGFESLFMGLGLCFYLGLCVKRLTSMEHLTKTHEFRHHHRWCHQWWPLISNLFLCSKFFFFFSLLVWFFVGWGLGQFTDLVFLCDIRIWRFFIWVWTGVWVWLFADLWVFFI